MPTPQSLTYRTRKQFKIKYSATKNTHEQYLLIITNVRFTLHVGLFLKEVGLEIQLRIWMDVCPMSLTLKEKETYKIEIELKGLGDYDV